MDVFLGLEGAFWYPKGGFKQERPPRPSHYAESKQILSTRIHLAYHPSLPQAGIFLKFEEDKRRLLSWLFEAKKRYGLTILNDMITSNRHKEKKHNGTKEKEDNP